MKALLEEVTLSNLSKSGYVNPADDVAKKIESSIQRKYSLTPACLSAEEIMGSTKRIPPVFVTAIPQSFVMDAELKIEGMIRYLLENKAKRFELVFSNRCTSDNLWSDKVLLAARYTDK